MVLVAASWLVPVLAERLATEEFFARRVTAALLTVAILVVGVLGIGIAYRVPGAEDLAYALDTFLQLLIVVALVALLTAPPRHPWRYVVASLALSSMSFFGPVLEYLVMVHWSEANWDAPPGSGYLSTGLMLLCGTALLIMTAAGRRPQPGLSPSAPQQVQQVDPVP